jgi:tRNA U34 5-methylaminomethyl-2-thiouridine-forming methyltransferase MnmC
VKKVIHLREMTTDDGSITLYNENYQEACHSSSGAIEETLVHYIKGCNIQSFLETNDCVRILEMGFGTGIGFKTTLDYINKHFPQSKLTFISLEIDEDSIKWGLRNIFQDEVWKDQLQISNNKYTLKYNNFELIIYLGNARKTIKEIEKNNLKFDCIYQDAFSPKRNPELWTVEWFSDLANVSNDNTTMSTYSASISIRKSMVEAGWALFPGVKFGKKRTSTRALKKGITDETIIDLLSRSPATATRDENQ